MERWALRIFVFLLLGAIVNVAVAWGCALWEPTSVIDVEMPKSQFRVPDYIARAGWPSPHSGHHYGEGFGFYRCYYQFIRSKNCSLWLDVYEYGWPCHALVRHSLYPTWSGSLDELLVTNDDEAEVESALKLMGSYRGIVVHSTAASETRLPVAPSWPGFAINTVSYAFIMWLLFARPFVVRRWRRIRRGLCPKCAYDLRGSVGTTACPECGAAVPKHKAETHKA